MLGLGRVVSKVGKDGVEDIEGFESFMHSKSMFNFKIWFNKDEKSNDL